MSERVDGRGKMASLRVGSLELSEMGERQNGLPEGGGMMELSEWGRVKMASLRGGGGKVELSEMGERQDGLPERGGGGWRSCHYGGEARWHP